MPNLHSGIGLLTPLLQARHGFDRCEVLPSGEAHSLFHLSTPSRHRIVIGWFLYVNTKTIIGAGPKTSHWTSITLDLTGLDSDTVTAYRVCFGGIWYWLYRLLLKLSTKCSQCSDTFYQTISFKQNDTLIQYWIATSIKLVLGVVD